MKLSSILLCLALALASCAGSAGSTSTRAPAPRPERPLGLYFDQFDDKEFADSFSDEAWVWRPTSCEYWKNLGICQEFELRVDPRFFSHHGSSNTAFLSGLVGDFETMLVVVEYVGSDDEWSSGAKFAVLTPRLTESDGGRAGYLRRLGLELGKPARFCTYLGTMLETSKPQWYVILDARSDRFQLVFSPWYYIVPHCSPVSELEAMAPDKLAGTGKYAGLWRDLYRGAAEAGIDEARSALNKFTERWRDSRRRFAESREGSRATRLRALAECAEALAPPFATESEHEEALQAHRADLAELLADLEAEAKSVEADRPSLAKFLSYLAKLVVRRGDGQPLEAYDHAELAAQRERLARFAGVVEWLDRFKFRDWKEDFETLDELLKRQTILELSSETFPDELNLAQVLPAVAAEVMAEEHERLASAASARGLHCTAAGHFYLAYNLRSIVTGRTWLPMNAFDPTADVPTERDERALFRARQEAMEIVWGFFPWLRDCEAGPEGYQLVKPIPGLFEELLSSGLGGPKGINLHLSDEVLERLAPQNARRPLCVWFGKPQLDDLRDVYTTNRRKVEWQEPEGVAPTLEFGTWQRKIEALETELRRVGVLMDEAAARNRVTSVWTGDLANQFTRHEDGWEITVTSNPETGESMVRRYDAEREYEALEKQRAGIQARLDALRGEKPLIDFLPAMATKSEFFESVTQEWSLYFRTRLVIEEQGQRAESFVENAITCRGVRHDACPRLGLEARDEWISGETFRSRHAEVEVNPELRIRHWVSSRGWTWKSEEAGKLGRLDVDWAVRDIEREWFDNFFGIYKGDDRFGEPVRKYILLSKGKRV